MKRSIVRFRNSRLRKFVLEHKRYLPVLFFVGGFIFDSLSLGRIDRVYDTTVLCLYMTFLTLIIYLYNRKIQRWENPFLVRLKLYFPLLIQFFFGGLSSAYVVYFSRSVTPSKTLIFFILLVALLFANEIFKKRISNKYLQFGFYSFISLTFFSFMIPVLTKKMSTLIFILSGLISLGITYLLVVLIYRKNRQWKARRKKKRLTALLVGIYVVFNLFYFTNIIPPVPLSLNTGIIAHRVHKENGHYWVTYEQDPWYIFWRAHRLKFIYSPGKRVYVFTSIFAPTALKKKIANQWMWYNPKTGQWENYDTIFYQITGGRLNGYRGYTYKENVKPGKWKVKVITEAGRIIGVIHFQLIEDSIQSPHQLVTNKF